MSPPAANLSVRPIPFAHPTHQDRHLLRKNRLKTIPLITPPSSHSGGRERLLGKPHRIGPARPMSPISHSGPIGPSESVQVRVSPCESIRIHPPTTLRHPLPLEGGRGQGEGALLSPGSCAKSAAGGDAGPPTRRGEGGCRRRCAESVRSVPLVLFVHQALVAGLP